ncbi:MAG: serine/threonine protein kinase, partial [Phycisphaerales bacterium]|nr:serine/threonine protein kinase [Phycisphaerales bacterium]
MTPEQYQRVREIFHRACELDPAEQDAFLAEACDGDAVILAEVRALLTYAADAPDAFRDDRVGIGRALVALDTSPHRNHGESLPASISGYRILRKIGEGGMGVVYEAEQQQPLRRVALKVLRPGLNTRSLLRRFAQEAQVLSRFQHPGIAHVYEAGTASTPSGEQPFFAMELVNGLPLNEFASRNSLSIHDRLRLFARLCDAVHHAHTRGIVHRDLKPANILIVEQDPATNHDDASTSERQNAESHRRDGTGGTGPASAQYDVKILDFGIAR